MLARGAKPCKNVKIGRNVQEELEQRRHHDNLMPADKKNIGKVFRMPFNYNFGKSSYAFDNHRFLNLLNNKNNNSFAVSNDEQ